MKIRIAASAALPLFVAVAALAVAPAARAQSFQPPPVTTGLWQSEVTVTIERVPGMATRGPVTAVTQSCMTPDTWKNTWKKFGHPERLQSQCTLTSIHQDSHQIVMDESCKVNGSSRAELHVEILIDSPQHVHGTVQMTMTVPHLPHPMVTKTKFESHFVSASCGTLKPGGVKTLKQ